MPDAQSEWYVVCCHRLTGVARQLQPILLGDNTRMFFGYNQAGLTQTQKVNVVDNLKAIVANHKLDPRLVAPPLRRFIGTS